MVNNGWWCLSKVNQAEWYLMIVLIVIRLIDLNSDIIMVIILGPYPTILVDYTSMRSDILFHQFHSIPIFSKQLMATHHKSHLRLPHSGKRLRSFTHLDWFYWWVVNILVDYDGLRPGWWNKTRTINWEYPAMLRPITSQNYSPYIMRPFWPLLHWLTIAKYPVAYTWLIWLSTNLSTTINSTGYFTPTITENQWFWLLIPSLVVAHGDPPLYHSHIINQPL